ncbi:MAG: hypothetical protein E7409_01035 [Ruminococcaceae bacterium]|nr:hypothetical protein [Oscillospiraceae bacterium]
MDAHPGEFVYAKAGRDKGKCFIVLSIDGEYLYLCDGKARKVSTPKKKKVKHVELTGTSDEFIRNKLSAIGKLTNKEVRYSLSKYLGELTNTVS